MADVNASPFFSATRVRRLRSGEVCEVLLPRNGSFLTGSTLAFLGIGMVKH